MAKWPNLRARLGHNEIYYKLRVDGVVACEGRKIIKNLIF